MGLEVNETSAVHAGVWRGVGNGVLVGAGVDVGVRSCAFAPLGRSPCPCCTLRARVALKTRCISVATTAHSCCRRKLICKVRVELPRYTF
eukprot:6208317-Pleurochrysis_carterae.AAC.1